MNIYWPVTLLLVLLMRSEISCQDTLVPLKLCDVHSKNIDRDCILIHDQIKNLSEAHKFCRSEGGFLPTEDDFNRTSSLLNPSKENLWSSMIFTNGHYQWISREPIYANMIEWRYRTPELWQSECALYNTRRKEFDIRPCMTVMPFFCIVNKYREKMIEGRDLKLKVRSNFPNNDGWIEVQKKDFNNLKLNCTVTDKYTGQIVPTIPTVHWIKDGIWIGQNKKDLNPSMFYDYSKDVNLFKNHLEITQQGTYCCHSWEPFSDTTLKSNCVLITLSEIHTLIVTTAVKNTNRIKSIINSVKKSSYFDKFLIDTAHIKNVALKEVENYDVKLHMYINKTEHTKIQNIIENFTNFPKNRLLENIQIKFATHCLSVFQLIGNNSKIGYHLTKAGKQYVSPFQCKAEENKLESYTCQWNFTYGAEVSERRINSCSKGFSSVGDNNLCLKLVTNLTWDESFPVIYQNRNEKSFFHDQNLLKTFVEDVTLRNDVNQYLLEANIHRVWFPLKRMYNASPLVYYSIGKPSSLTTSFIKNSRNLWLTGHPQSHKKCVVFDVKESLLMSEYCSSHHDIVLFTNGFKSDELLDGKNDKSVCDSDWKLISISKNNQLCVKIFPRSEKKSRNQAIDFCQTFGATLPSPCTGFLDWYLRNIITENDTVWLNIEDTKENNRSHHQLNNLHRSVENSSQYAVMNKRRLFFVSDIKIGTKRTVICTKNTEMKKDGSINLIFVKNKSIGTRMKKSLKMKLKLNFDRTNFIDQPQCFKNGQPVQLNPDFNGIFQNIPYFIELKDQGYYECNAWSKYSWIPLWSNKFEYLQKDVNSTFVISGTDAVTLYDPFVHDSTFIHAANLPKFETFCIHEILNEIKSYDSSLDIGLVQYSNDSQTGKFKYKFHLKCSQRSEGNCSSMEIDIENLNRTLLTNSKTANKCSLSSDVRSAIGCRNQITDTIDERNLTWSKTKGTGSFMADDICLTDDGRPAKRICEGNFVDGYEWLPSPKKCHKTSSNQTQDLWQIFKDPHGYLEGKYQNLTVLTDNSQSIIAADFFYVASSLESISKDPLVKDKLSFDDLVSTMNNMMGVNENTIDLVYKDTNGTASLLDTFEKLAFLTSANDNFTKQITKERIAVKCIDLSKNSSIVGFQSVKSLETNVLSSHLHLDLTKLETAIVFPKKLTMSVKVRSNTSKLLFVVYNNIGLFKVPHDEYAIDSQVVQATFEGTEVKNLDQRIKIYFRRKHIEKDVKCVFWDFKMNDGKGGWSGEGCSTIHIDKSLVTCECNHLTSFALLIRYSDSAYSHDPSHEYALELISIIGSCLSMIGLVLVLATYCLFESYRKSLDNKILANLSLAIFFSLIIFVTGIQQTWNSILCKGVAVSLHYFILASFGWMFIEAIHQYQKFVKVYGTYIPRFIYKAMLCAWGLPLLPIILVLVIDSDLYNNGEYDRLCWMSSSAFLYSFLAPIVLVLIANCIAFISIIHATLFTRRKMNSTLSQRQVLKRELTMAVCVFFLLGFTWLFGLLSFSSNTVIFAYLFCIFNTMQGFIIFFFHVFINIKVREMWKNFILGRPQSRRRTYNSYNSASTFSRSSSNRSKYSARSRLSNVSSILPLSFSISYINDNSKF